jgi:hypothetical protein
MSNLTAAGGPVVLEKQAPGTLIYVRVIALNSIGASAPSSWRALQAPFVASQCRSEPDRNDWIVCDS